LTDHPATYKEAMSRPDKELWEAAINAELAALQAKHVYTEVTLPEDATAIPSKLVLDIKRDEYGNVDKYKARLVAKGFRQVAGRDYDEVFDPQPSRSHSKFYSLWPQPTTSQLTSSMSRQHS
jgi:hypothetical protein